MSVNKIFAALVSAALIIVFPWEVCADTRYFYTQTGIEGNLLSHALNFYGDFTPDEQAFFLFDTLFLSGSSAPKGTRVLSAKIYGDLLILNVSGEIKNYGGTFREMCVVDEILTTASSVPGVAYVTLLIDGAADYLPEGSQIFERKIFFADT